MSFVINEETWNELLSSISSLTISHDVLRTEIHTSTKAIDSVNLRLTKHDDRISEVERTITILNKQMRSKNLVLFKLEDSDEINRNLSNIVLSVFNNIGLKIPDVAVDDIFRIGKNKEARARPVLIKFSLTQWFRMAFTKVKEISNAGYAIANNRSREEREQRRSFLDQIHKLRGKGHDAKLKGDDILVNGVKVSAEKINLLLASRRSIISSPENRFKNTPHSTPKRHNSSDNPPSKRGRKSNLARLGNEDLSNTKTLDYFVSPLSSTVTPMQSKNDGNQNTNGPVQSPSK